MLIEEDRKVYHDKVSGVKGNWGVIATLLLGEKWVVKSRHKGKSFIS